MRTLCCCSTGEASQKGFYKYEGKRKANPDPEITNYVVESRRMTGAAPDPQVWFSTPTFLFFLRFSDMMFSRGFEKEKM